MSLLAIKRKSLNNKAKKESRWGKKVTDEHQRQVREWREAMKRRKKKQEMRWRKENEKQMNLLLFHVTGIWSGHYGCDQKQFSLAKKREREDHVIDKRPALYLSPNLVLRLPSNKNRREQVFFSYHFLFLPSQTPPSFNSLLYLLRQLLNYLYFEIQDWLQASRVEVDLFCLTSDDCIQYSENSSWLLF